MPSSLGRRNFLLLSAALLAGCSARAMPTAPSGGSGGATTPVVSPTPPTLRPSASWTGVPSSGYAGLPPVDPPRTTAKPSLRMASAWGARISGSTYRIYVDAECAGLASGTAFGVAAVNGYLEGGSAAATFGQYSYAHPADATKTVTIQCYAFDIDVASCVAAHANGGVDFYAEAIPRDTTMQKRVIGPFRFYPRSTQYSGQYDVGVGQTYSTRRQAIAAIVAANEEAPLILYHTTANYEAEDCSAYGAYAGQKGFITEKAAPGVTATISRAVFPTGVDDNSMFWDPGPDGIEWGPGIVLDPRNWSFIKNHNQTLNDGLKHGHRLNGCQVINSEGTLDSYYWNGRPRPSGLWSAPGFIEDSTIKWLVGGMSGTFLCRNVAVRGNLREAAANCYYQNKVFMNGWDAWTFWSPKVVMTLAYTGPGVGRHWITGSQPTSAPGAVFHLSVNGVETHTIQLGFYPGDPNFSQSQLAATINAFGDGWVAAKVLDGPAASQQQGVDTGPNTSGLGTPTVVGSTPVTISAAYDFHQDYWHSINQTAVSAPYTTGPVQGTILRDVNVKGATYKSDGITAPFFMRLDTAALDLCILECANDILQNGDAGTSANVYMRGCSAGHESWDPGPMGPYSRFEANIGHIFWNSASPRSSPAYVNNLLYAEASVFSTGKAAISSAPHSGNQVLSAADYPSMKASVAALYVNVSAGDWRPAPLGQLAVPGNKHARTTVLDAAGNAFANPDVVGQLALGLSSARTWPV